MIVVSTSSFKFLVLASVSNKFIFSAVPMKNVHQVEVTWALPPLLQHYRLVVKHQKDEIINIAFTLIIIIVTGATLFAFHFTVILLSRVNDKE